MSTKHPESADTSQDMISLATLPYDLLLNIARHLEFHDIYAVQLVSLISHLTLHSLWRARFRSVVLEWRTTVFQSAHSAG